MFTVIDFKLPIGDLNGTLFWTYTNDEGSINGRTPITLAQLPQIDPSTVSPGSLSTWLGGYAGNTPEELDAAITANNTRATEAAAQQDYQNVDGEWVLVTVTD